MYELWKQSVAYARPKDQHVYHNNVIQLFYRDNEAKKSTEVKPKSIRTAMNDCYQKNKCYFHIKLTFYDAFTLNTSKSINLHDPLPVPSAGAST